MPGQGGAEEKNGSARQPAAGESCTGRAGIDANVPRADLISSVAATGHESGVHVDAGLLRCVRVRLTPPYRTRRDVGGVWHGNGICTRASGLHPIHAYACTTRSLAWTCCSTPSPGDRCRVCCSARSVARNNFEDFQDSCRQNIRTARIY